MAGIGVGGVGVVGVGIGVIFGLKARSLADDVSTKYDPDKVDRGERANKIAITGLVGGTVLVALGVTLYWRGHAAKKHTDEVSLTPMVGDQMAGFAVSGLLP